MDQSIPKSYISFEIEITAHLHAARLNTLHKASRGGQAAIGIGSYDIVLPRPYARGVFGNFIKASICS